MKYKLILTNNKEYPFTQEEVARQQKTIGNYSGRKFINIKGLGIIPFHSILGWFEDGEEVSNITPQAAGVRSVKNRNCCDSPKIEMRKGKDGAGKWEYREQCVSCCARGARITAGKVENIHSLQEFMIPNSEYTDKLAKLALESQSE